MFTSVQDLRVQMMKMKKVDASKAQILTLLLDATQKVAKEQRREAVTEDISVAVKKMIKMAEQAVQMNVAGAKDELEYLQTFAPKMMSEDETRKIVTELKSLFDGNVGTIMKELKQVYGDTIDMKLASQLIKTL